MMEKRWNLNLDMGWLNLAGLIILILLLIPNIVYAVKCKDAKNRCQNIFMNRLEQIGRYATMFLMVFNIGIAEFGFSSLGSFFVYLFGNGFFIILYWIVWLLYFSEQKLWKSMALAIIPTILFLLSGITMMHVPLIISALIFGIGHIYVTYQNNIQSNEGTCVRN